MTTPIVASASSEKVVILASAATATEIEDILVGSAQISTATGWKTSTPTVLIGDHPQLFHAGIRDAVEENRARVIYVLSSSGDLPMEASGFPIFGFLSRPRSEEHTSELQS